MASTRITDPDILAQLNAPQSGSTTIPPVVVRPQSKLEKITDPAILAQLNAPTEKPNPMQNYFMPTTKPISNEQAVANRKWAGHALQGAAQSFINTPEEAANVFGKHMYNKFDFAPEDEAAQYGGIGGDVGSYFLPGGALKGGMKILSYAPKINKILEGIQMGLKSKPITNFLANVTKNAGEAALFHAEKNPEATNTDIGEAAGWGAGFTTLTNAIANKNPLISLGAKLALGGGLGYQQDGMRGAAAGAGAMVTVPKLLSEINAFKPLERTGLAGMPVEAEMLSKSPNALAQSRYQAGQDIGAPIRPSEAFGSPQMGASEANAGRSEAGGAAMEQAQEQAVAQQQNAIQKLLNTIYPKTKASGNAIRQLYNDAFTHELPQSEVNALLQDPLIAQAKKNVQTNPAYQRKLQGVPENNFAYLDQMKRNLQAEAKVLRRAGNDTEAAEYEQASKNLIKQMDTEFPAYANAREASQAKITRKQLEKALGKKEINGRTFFNEVLRNDNKYQETLGKIKNNPEATEQLQNMKLAWEHLIGKETVRSAAGSAAKATDANRNYFQDFWAKYKNMFGAERDVERVKFMHDPNWWNKFDDVMKFRDQTLRNRALGNLIAEALGAGAMETAKETK